MNLATKRPVEDPPLTRHAGGTAWLAWARQVLVPATWRERTVLLVALLTVMRWAIASTTDLSDTEAYYAQWSRHLSLSYYDHPPLVAWSSWLATELSGGVTRAPWVVRVIPVMCAVAFNAAVYRIAEQLFSPRAGFFAVALVAATPVFFFTGFLVNPEALLAPLWGLFLILLLELRDHDEPWRPLVLGAVVGVAFLAKYTAVLAVPVALLFLAVDGDARRWLRRPSLYAGGLVALALTLPVIVWNAQRHWPSLQLHLSERMAQPVGETLGAAVTRVGLAQLAFFQPIILPALVAVMIYAASRSGRDRRFRFLVVASVPVLAFLLTMMVRAADSEPHWTMMGYLPLLIAAGGILDESRGTRRRVVYGVFRVAIGLSAVVALAYSVHLRSAVFAKFAAAHGAYNPDADPVNETLGWDRVRDAAQDSASRLGPAAVVVGAHNVLCGHLQSALDDRPEVYCRAARRTQFDFVGRRTPPVGAPIVLVDSDRYPETPSSVLPGYTCTPDRAVEIERAGLRVARFRLQACLPSHPAAIAELP